MRIGYFRPFFPRWAHAALLIAALLTALAGCAETPSPESAALFECREAMDTATNLTLFATVEEGWTNAIVACEAVIPTDPAANPARADIGYSLSAQAYMGRAGISLLDLISATSTSQLSGLALILDLFAIDIVAEPTKFADVAQALAYMGALSCVSDAATDCDGGDLFNMLVASDVALTSLFKAHLNITIDATDPDNPAMVIPGVTDAGLDTLAGTPTATAVQGVLNNIYTSNGTLLTTLVPSYYTTRPLVWADPATTATVDLARVTQFVGVNAFAAAAMGLASGDALGALDFSSSIDNGQCGLSTGQTASGVDNTADGALVAPLFPRRLNTSDDVNDSGVAELEPEFVTDEIQYVQSGEWGGGFLLPSALLNPDFVQISCGGTIGIVGDDTDFSDCMTGEKLVGVFAAQTEGGSANDICAVGTCTNWPVLGVNGDPANNETTVELAGAAADLARVLHILYPIDNAVTDATLITGTRPAYACVAGDGLVHYREYDYYLRSFGQ